MDELLGTGFEVAEKDRLPPAGAATLRFTVPLRPLIDVTVTG
jgi:hypothetical protein